MLRQLLRFCAVSILALNAAIAGEHPNNPTGVHLMIRDARSPENIDRHTAWARRVCGPWGYVKIFEYHITPDTQEPPQSLIDLINKLYERQLIPVLRLGGDMTNGIWQRPSDTPDGTFGDIADAFKRVVERVPRSDQCPLYVEVWNEPNLGLEWSGKPNPSDFAKMYVRAAKAIRSIGDPRIRVAPGAMSPGGEYESLEFIKVMCEAEPEFVRSFDYWATHPYPQGTAPERNIHDQTTTMRYACIDLWKYELDVLAEHGCDIRTIKVIGTETGYRFDSGHPGQPAIDAQRRADYHLRAFRDYWYHWPEVLGMCIWDFANPFEIENKSTWVRADSTTDPTGWPSSPALDFKYVAALAKPTSDYASISGRFIDARTGGGIPGITVSLDDASLSFSSDRLGHYILSPVRPTPGSRVSVTYESNTHGRGRKQIGDMPRGQNIVRNITLEATTLATLRATVINTLTGNPLPDAMIEAEPGHFGTRTNHQGIFELNQLPHGYYDITVNKKGFYPHRQNTKLIPAGQITQCRYRLGPGQEVHNNMLGNGGFEQADAGARTALGWNTHGQENAVSMETENVFAGDRAQRIDGGKGKSGIIQWTGYTTVFEGKRYRLQCWLKTRNIQANDGKGACVTGTVVTNPHKTLMELRSETVLRGDHSWTLVSTDFTAPPDAGRVSLCVELEAESGTCWVDEAAVLPLD